MDVLTEQHGAIQQDNASKLYKKRIKHPENKIRSYKITYKQNKMVKNSMKNHKKKVKLVPFFCRRGQPLQRD